MRVPDLRRIVTRWIGTSFLLATLASSAFAAASGGLSWAKTLVSLDEPAGATTAVARFQFENTSPDAIEIVGLQTSCDCTTAISTKSVCPPGETGEIVATMTMGDRSGRQDKTITVTTADAAGRKFVHTLMMRVQIPEWVSCSKQLLTWPVGGPSTEQTVDLSIAPSIKEARVSLNSIEPAQVEVQLERRSTTAYRVRLRPKSTAQPASFVIKLSVDAATQGSRLLEIVAVVR
jgi:hypothetical protein